MEEEKDLTWQELEKALKVVKGEKSTGVDKLSIDMVNAAHELGKQCMYCCMIIVWTKRKALEDWKKG